MDRIQTLEVFVAVAEEESFAAGARRTGLSAPSATRAINTLEARLGARLFTRTTRKVRLTDVGLAYLEDTRQVLAQLQAADDAATGAALNPVGQLRITCPNEFGRIYVMPVLTEYLDTFPDVSASVVMVDRVVNMVEEGFDIAVRIGSLPPSGLSAIKVGQVRRVVCGTSAYFEKHGRPEKPADLTGHNIVAITGANPALEWRFGQDLDIAVRLKPRLTVTSVAAGISTAKSGWGLCRVLSYQVGPDLKSGALEAVLAHHEPDPAPIRLVHIEGRRAAAKVRSFLDFAKERLSGLEALK